MDDGILYMEATMDLRMYRLRDIHTTQVKGVGWIYGLTSTIEGNG